MVPIILLNKKNKNKEWRKRRKKASVPELAESEMLVFQEGGKTELGEKHLEQGEN